MWKRLSTSTCTKGEIKNRAEESAGRGKAAYSAGRGMAHDNLRNTWGSLGEERVTLLAVTRIGLVGRHEVLVGRGGGCLPYMC